MKSATIRVPAHGSQADGARQEETQEQAGPRAGPGAAPRRVLVVDDAPETARLLATLLGLLVHEVEIALDAEEALQAAERFAPDCAILDLGLPGMGGLELARRMRADARHRGLQLIALTAWTRSEDRAQVQAAGFDHYLAKPLNFERLSALLSPQPPG